MIQIRKNVFETNSSSTHSMVMCVDSDYDKWVKGDVYYCNWSIKDAGFESGKFYSKAEVEEYFKGREDERDIYDLCTYDEFCDTEYLEIEEDTYTTPGGETVHAVCKYGYDG